MSNIGAAIKAARREAGLTMRDLAAVTDIDFTYICRIEQGNRCPTVSTVVKIAGVFPNVNEVEWLWAWVEDQVGHPTAVEMANWVTATDKHTAATLGPELGR